MPNRYTETHEDWRSGRHGAGRWSERGPYDRDYPRDYYSDVDRGRFEAYERDFGYGWPGPFAGYSRGYERPSERDREAGRHGYIASREPYGYPERERSRERDWRERERRGWMERAGDEVRSWFGDEEAERRRRMDERREQSFRGLGPKGYKRSDDRIREDVSDRLMASPDLDPTDVEVSVSDGIVYLDGTVDSRWAKRTAEDIAETVYGVDDVQNRIRVNRGDANRAATRETETPLPGQTH